MLRQPVAGRTSARSKCLQNARAGADAAPAQCECRAPRMQHLPLLMAHEGDTVVLESKVNFFELIVS